MRSAGESGYLNLVGSLLLFLGCFETIFLSACKKEGNYVIMEQDNLL